MPGWPTIIWITEIQLNIRIWRFKKKKTNNSLVNTSKERNVDISELLVLQSLVQQKWTKVSFNSLSPNSSPWHCGHAVQTQLPESCQQELRGTPACATALHCQSLTARPWSRQPHLGVLTESRGTGASQWSVSVLEARLLPTPWSWGVVVPKNGGMGKL